MWHKCRGSFVTVFMALLSVCGGHICQSKFVGAIFVRGAFDSYLVPNLPFALSTRQVMPCALDFDAIEVTN